MQHFGGERRPHRAPMWLCVACGCANDMDEDRCNDCGADTDGNKSDDE